MPTQTIIIKKGRKYKTLRDAKKAAAQFGAKKLFPDWFPDTGKWHFRQIAPGRFSVLRTKVIDKDVSIVTGKLKGGNKMAKKKRAKKTTTKKRTTKRKAVKKWKATRKKKPVAKKTVRKKATKRKRKKSNPGNPGNPKKRVIKNNPKKRGNTVAKKKKRSPARRRRLPGGGKMMDIVQEAAGVVGGAVGAGVAASAIPLPDPKLKPFIPIAAGIVLASMKIGRTKMMKALSMGMMAAGGLALVRQFAPNVPLLAGEDEMYLDYVPESEEERALLGQYRNDDLLLGQSDDLEDIEDALDGDSVLMGESELLGEDELWLTPAATM